MSKNTFNGESVPVYVNHVQILKAAHMLAVETTRSQQPPSMQESMQMLMNPRKAEEYAQKQQQLMSTVMLSMEKIKRGVQNSATVGEETKDSFAAYFLSQQHSIATQGKMVQIQHDPTAQGQMVMLSMEIQDAQQTIVEKKRELYQALYGFHDDDTLYGPSLPENMTFEDFERAEALIKYGYDSDDILSALIPALQTGDHGAIDELLDKVEETQNELNALDEKVATSTSMEAVEQSVAAHVVQSMKALYQTIGDAMHGLASDNTAAMNAMLDMPKLVKNIQDAQTHYYSVLENHYTSKTAQPSNDNSNDKKGPKSNRQP